MSATIQDNYCDCLNQLSVQPLIENAQVMGLDVDGQRVWLPYFNQRFAIDANTIVDALGRKPTDAVGLVLCRYLLNHPLAPVPDGQRVTFRELSGAGPLVARFADNTNKIIASAHNADVGLLTQRTLGMGGKPETERGGFDLVIRFDALPNLPIWLQFNGADDIFPAQSTLCFNQSVEQYLDMQSLFIVCTYLTGQLVTQSST